MTGLRSAHVRAAGLSGDSGTHKGGLLRLTLGGMVGATTRPEQWEATGDCGGKPRQSRRLAGEV
jgi:hypothetical protein